MADITPLELASNIVGVLIVFAVTAAIWTGRAFILAIIAYCRLRLRSRASGLKSASNTLPPLRNTLPGAHPSIGAKGSFDK